MVEADTRFTDEPEPGKTTEEKIKPRNVGIIMLIPALLAPIAFSFYGEPGWDFYFSMISFLWIINYDRGGFYIYPTFFSPGGFNPFYLLSMMMSMSIYVGPRFVFAYQLVRLYKGRTTKKRALLLGFVADSFFLFLMLPTLIIMLLSPYPYFSIVLPIPIAFVIALLLIKFRPPAKVITPWKGVDEPDKWWEQQEAPPAVSTPPRTQATGAKVDEKKPSKPKDGSWWEEEEKDKKKSKEPTSPW